MYRSITEIKEDLAEAEEALQDSENELAFAEIKRNDDRSYVKELKEELKNAELKLTNKK